MKSEARATALHGQTIVLTGGSSGIGLAIARQLARKGNTVYSFDLSPFPVRTAGVHSIVADLTKSEEVRRGMEQVPCPIHVLVNNAGLMRRGTIFDASEDDFDTLFSVHVKGAWLMLREAQAKLSTHALIVQMSSVHALQRSANPGLYTLAKQTVAQLAENISHGYPQYTVKTIFPGPVDTPLARFGVEGEKLHQKEKVMQSPESVATTIIDFLESTGSRLLYESESRRYMIG